MRLHGRIRIPATAGEWTDILTRHQSFSNVTNLLASFTRVCLAACLPRHRQEHVARPHHQERWTCPKETCLDPGTMLPDARTTRTVFGTTVPCVGKTGGPIGTTGMGPGKTGTELGTRVINAVRLAPGPEKRGECLGQMSSSMGQRGRCSGQLERMSGQWGGCPGQLGWISGQMSSSMGQHGRWSGQLLHSRTCQRSAWNNCPRCWDSCPKSRDNWDGVWENNPRARDNCPKFHSDWGRYGAVWSELGAGLAGFTSTKTRIDDIKAQCGPRPA